MFLSRKHFKVFNTVILESLIFVVDVIIFRNGAVMMLPYRNVEAGLTEGAIPLLIGIKVPGSRFAGTVRVPSVFKPIEVDNLNTIPPN